MRMGAVQKSVSIGNGTCDWWTKVGRAGDWEQWGWRPAVGGCAGSGDLAHDNNNNVFLGVRSRCAKLSTGVVRTYGGLSFRAFAQEVAVSARGARASSGERDVRARPMSLPDLYGCTVSQRVAVFNSFFVQRKIRIVGKREAARGLHFVDFRR